MLGCRYLLGLLRGGGIVQVRQRLSVHFLVKNGEVCPQPVAKVPGGGSCQLQIVVLNHLRAHKDVETQALC